MGNATDPLLRITEQERETVGRKRTQHHPWLITDQPVVRRWLRLRLPDRPNRDAMNVLDDHQCVRIVSGQLRDPAPILRYGLLRSPAPGAKAERCTQPLRDTAPCAPGSRARTPWSR